LRKANQPGWFAPMLATLKDEPFSREGWLFEPRLDGERCLVFRNEAKLELYSRNQKLLNTKYPELVEAFRKQKCPPFIVDGEIVTFEGAVTSLEAPTTHAGSTPVSRIAQAGPRLVLCLRFAVLRYL